VQPDLQYILQPGGIGQIPDAFVAGLQAGVNFLMDPNLGKEPGRE